MRSLSRRKRIGMGLANGSGSQIRINSKSLHFGYFKICEPKWVTRIDFRMTGVRTGMHLSES